MLIGFKCFPKKHKYLETARKLSAYLQITRKDQLQGVCEFLIVTVKVLNYINRNQQLPKDPYSL